MARSERFANDAATTLNGAITNSATSLIVTSAAKFPTLTGAEQFRIRVENTAGSGTNLEYMLVTATSGTTFTVIRGSEGTAGVAHIHGSAVTLVVTTASLTAVLTHGIVYAAAYGVTGGASDGDQSVKFEAALLGARQLAVAAGSQFASLTLPAGVINVGVGRSVGFAMGPTADGPAVILRGQGKDATVISWSQQNDLAYGIAALDWTGTGTLATILEDVSVIGPGVSTSRLGLPPGRAGGGAYVSMDGVRLAQSCSIQRVKVQRFNIGVYAMNSHIKLTDVVSGGNYAGVVVDGNGPVANNGYMRCDFTGNTFASMIVTKQNGLAADLMTDCHTGFNPIAFYHANSSDGVGNPFCSSTQMIGVAVESCGHGAFYCEDQTGSIGPNNEFLVTCYNVPDTNFRIATISITGCTLTNASAVVTIASTNSLNRWMPVANANLPAGTVIRSIDSATQFTLSANATATASAQTLTVDYRTDSAISVSSCSGNNFVIADLLTAVAGTSYIVDAPGGFKNNRIGHMDGIIKRADGIKVLSPATTISDSGGLANWFDGNNLGMVTVERAGATITAGQLLQYGGTGGFWRVKPYVAGGSVFCVGQATSDAALGDAVGVVKSGNSLAGLPDAAFVNNGFGDPLKPSTTTDGKFTNGTFGTSQIIGFIRNGNVFTLSGRT